MILPRFQKGRPLAAADLNLLVEALNRNRILPGVGVKLVQTLNGTTVSVKPTRSGGGGSTQEDFPFKIVTSADSSESGEIEGYKATVSPGTLNNLLPSNLFNQNQLTEFSYSKDQIRHVVLIGESNGKQFTSCELAVQAEAPPAQPPTLFGLPAEVQILLGVVFNGTVYQIVKTHLLFAGKQLFLKDREEPAEPGQLPYEAYFIWA